MDEIKDDCQSSWISPTDIHVSIAPKLCLPACLILFCKVEFADIYTRRCKPDRQPGFAVPHFYRDCLLRLADRRLANYWEDQAESEQHVQQLGCDPHERYGHTGVYQFPQQLGLSGVKASGRGAETRDIQALYEAMSDGGGRLFLFASIIAAIPTTAESNTPSQGPNQLAFTSVSSPARGPVSA